MIERKLLQLAVIIGSAVPLSVGGAGALFGPKVFQELVVYIPFDNHFRYLSGLLLAIGLGFLSCVRKIELRTERVRILGAIVFIGGLCRLYGIIMTGNPGLAMWGGLAMELIVTPLLCLWQARVAKRVNFIDQLKP